jgi:hypothetical protein
MTTGRRTETGYKLVLREALQEQGFTKRQSKYLLSVFFDVIVAALTDHQSVELPFGTLEVVPAPKTYSWLVKDAGAVRGAHLKRRYTGKYKVVLRPKS